MSTPAGGAAPGGRESEVPRLRDALAREQEQRRRYQALFSHAPMPYLATDTAGRIADANQAAGDLLGATPDQLRGAALQDHVSGERELLTKLAELRPGGAVAAWETEVHTADGAPLPVAISARRPDEGEGSAAEVHWVIQDIRGQRQALDQERELHREQAARAALEQVAVRARFLSDASARLMGVIDSMEAWRTAAELAGEHALGSVVLEGESTDTFRVRAVGGTGSAVADLAHLVGESIRLDAAGAELLPVDAIRTALAVGEAEVIPAPEDAPDSAGACLAVPLRAHERTLGALVVWLHPNARIGEELLVMRNLSDRVAQAVESAIMFEELTRARRRAEEASQAEADFLSVVSHELRTPLTAIISYAQLLEDRAHELPEKLERYAHRIAAAADHQRELVQQILSYKRVQGGDEALTPEELDFRKVARSAVAMVRPQAEDRIQVEAVLPSEPVAGTCDRGKLQQILTNLLSNAVRHTAAGHVRLTLEPVEDDILFVVEDTGEGIPSEELPRIFDRFWRGAGSGRERGRSGLGLTITRELVGRMSGSIDVRSEPGVGTRFAVRIPRVAPEESPPDARPRP